MLFLIASIVVFIGICLWRVSTKKTERTTFWAGGILVATGLGLSLLFPAWISKLFANIAPEQSQYLSNTFLIVASIGANLLAASLFMDNKKSSGLCSKCKLPLRDDATQPTLENLQPTKPEDLIQDQHSHQQKGS